MSETEKLYDEAILYLKENFAAWIYEDIVEHLAAKDKEIEELRRERDLLEGDSQRIRINSELARAKLSALKARIESAEITDIVRADGRNGRFYLVPVMSTESPHQQNVSKNEGEGEV